MEKADKIDLFKLYPQFMQAVDSNTTTQKPDVCKVAVPPENLDVPPDKFEKSTQTSSTTLHIDDTFEKTHNTLNDLNFVQNPFADITKVREVFKDFIKTADTLQTQVNELDKKVLNDNNSLKNTFESLGMIVPFRRVTSVPDKIKDKDYIGATGAVAVAGLLLPEDLRDTRDCLKQILYNTLPRGLKLSIAKKSKKFYKKFILYKPKYDPKEYQVPFSFIRGSYLEKIVNRIGGKTGYYLHKWDKTLLDTKLGHKMMDLLKIEEVDKVFTGRLVPQILENQKTGSYFKQDVQVFAKKLEGSTIGKLICRTMQRMTVYGSLSLVAIAIPSIIMAIKNSKNTEDKIKNGSKRTLKTAISVTSSLAFIGLGGALLAPIGPFGSIAGMAIGSALSAYISRKINKNIQ
ncbi:MAG: hypothetical protein WC197_07420 [Candidatus Gastranaerophilaceae bacterium]